MSIHFLDFQTHSVSVKLSILLTFCIAIALMTASCAGGGSSGTGLERSVEGIFLLEGSDEPIPEALVEVVGANGQVLAATLTDELGSFRLEYVLPGLSDIPEFVLRFSEPALFTEPQSIAFAGDTPSFFAEFILRSDGSGVDIREQVALPTATAKPGATAPRPTVSVPTARPQVPDATATVPGTGVQNTPIAPPTNTASSAPTNTPQATQTNGPAAAVSINVHFYLKEAGLQIVGAPVLASSAISSASTSFNAGTVVLGGQSSLSLIAVNYSVTISSALQSAQHSGTLDLSAPLQGTQRYAGAVLRCSLSGCTLDQTFGTLSSFNAYVVALPPPTPQPTPTTPPCPWDQDGNGVVNAADRGFVIANIGCEAALPLTDACIRADVFQSTGNPPDLDGLGDGIVNVDDRNEIANHYGPCPT